MCIRDRSEEKAASEPPANPRPEPSVPRNFRFSADYDLYPGGAKTKYKNNILAIKTLKPVSYTHLAQEEQQMVEAVLSESEYKVNEGKAVLLRE